MNIARHLALFLAVVSLTGCASSPQQSTSADGPVLTMETEGQVTFVRSREGWVNDDVAHSVTVLVDRQGCASVRGPDGKLRLLVLAAGWRVKPDGVTKPDGRKLAFNQLVVGGRMSDPRWDVEKANLLRQCPGLEDLWGLGR